MVSGSGEAPGQAEVVWIPPAAQHRAADFVFLELSGADMNLLRVATITVPAMILPICVLYYTARCRSVVVDPLDCI